MEEFEGETDPLIYLKYITRKVYHIQRTLDLLIEGTRQNRCHMLDGFRRTREAFAQTKEIVNRLASETNLIRDELAECAGTIQNATYLS